LKKILKRRQTEGLADSNERALPVSETALQECFRHIAAKPYGAYEYKNRVLSR
jgi:hypothetical protein